MDMLTFVFYVLVLLAVLGVVYGFRTEFRELLRRTIKVDVTATGGSFEAAPPVSTPPALPDIAPKSEPPSDTLSNEQERKESLAENATAESPSLWQAYQALQKENVEEAEKIFGDYIKTIDDPDSQYEDKAFFLHLLLQMGLGENALARLAELHKTATNDRHLESSTTFLAGAYGRIDDYENEEKVWRGAIAICKDEMLSTVFIAGLARHYDRRGQTQQGIALLMERLRAVGERDQLSLLYSALADLEKKNNRAEIAAIALEKAVEHAPGDGDKLFSAAYLQSEQKLPLLSITNYRTLIGQNSKHATARNNLGVCAGAFSVLGKKISLYRSAVEHGSTLAMANLANEKIDVGLYDEAQEILDAARVKESPHENVGHALYRLEQARKDETKRWAAITDRAAAFQRQVRTYGDALFAATAPQSSWEGTWFTPLGEEIQVSVSAQSVSGTWSETGRGLGLLSAVAHFKCSIVGSIQNRSARVVYQRKDASERKGIATSLLGSAPDVSYECFSYLSGDYQRWDFFSTDNESSHNFMFTRSKPGA